MTGYKKKVCMITACGNKKHDGQLPERMRELLPDMIPVLQEYDEVIFFKAGSRKLYADCMEDTCSKAGRALDSLGFGFMGGIGRLEEKIKDAYRS